MPLWKSPCIPLLFCHLYWDKAWPLPAVQVNDSQQVLCSLLQSGQCRGLSRGVCWAQPHSLCLELPLPGWERSHHSRDGCKAAPPAALLLFSHHAQNCLGAARKCITMSNGSARELTISWLLYQVQSQVTHPITSPRQQALMRIRMTKQKKNGAKQNECSSSSPPMHHLQALDCWANPGLWNNHLLMLVFSYTAAGLLPWNTLERREHL